MFKRIERFFFVFFLFFLIATLSAQTQEKTDLDYGMRLINEGLYDLAAIQFDQFLQKYPDSPQAAKVRFSLAQSYFLSAKYSDAQQTYLSLIVQNPQSPDCAEAQYKIAVCFERSGDLKSAATSYNRVYLYYPKSPWAERGLYRCGKLSLQLGDAGQAESAIKSLIGVTDNRDLQRRATILLADIYVAQSQPVSAIAILNPIKDNPFAAIKSGQIYCLTGEFEKAEPHFLGVLKSTKNDTLIQTANLELAELFEIQGKSEDALKYYQLSSKTGPSVMVQQESFLGMGKIHEVMRRFDQALTDYVSVLQLASVDSIQIRALLGQGRCLYLLGRFSESVQVLKQLTGRANVPDAMQKNASLLLATSLKKSGQNEASIQTCLDYLKRFPDDDLAPWVSLAIAEINIRQLGFISEGLFQLQQIWTQFSVSRAVPPARFLYATGLEKNRRFQEAEQIHRLILRTCLGSVSAVKSQNLLETVYRYSGNGTLPFIHENETVDLQLGDYFANSLFDFPRAIQYFQRIHSNADSILYRIVSACYRLYTLDPQPSVADSLRRYAESMIANRESSSDDVRAKILLAELDAGTDAQILFTGYRQIMNEHSVIPDPDRFYLRIGKAAIEIDSLDRAMDLLKLSRSKDVPFWQGKILYRKGNGRAADSLFSNYLKTATLQNHIPEALFSRAKIQSQTGQDSLALSLLQTIQNRYSFSTIVDSAKLLSGQILLRQGKYDLALTQFQTIVHDDSLCKVTAFVEFCDPTPSPGLDALFGLARSYEGVENIRSAKSTCFRVLRSNPDAQLRESIYKVLSRIAEHEGQIERAIEYEEDSKSQTDSTLYRIGRLHMKSGDYPAAAKSFLAALNANPPDALSLEIHKSLALSFLKQGQLPQAESARLVIEKNNKDIPGYEDALAEIEIERGMAFAQNKDFDLALESFDRVKKKFKKTAWTSRADFETGRVLLITNKTEKALELLTEMTAKYPDDPVLDRVYLNLGDHYFRSQQYENALDAFKKVVESKRDPEMTPLGLRYLIRVYETLGMFDAAIWMTRQYIDTNPNADDILQKKVQLGLYDMQLKEFPDAIVRLRAVQPEADSETEAEIQYWIGKCYAEMGQFQQAVFEYLKVKYVSKPTKLPWASTALFEAAKAYERLKEPTKARQLYGKVVIAEGRTSDLGRIAQQKIDELSQTLQ